MAWSKTPKQDLAGQPEQQVIKAALRYLGRREYTAKELTQRLRERGAESGAIGEALVYTQQRAYQSDARAGESHIRQRLEYAPRGRVLVRQELKERGLSAELADNLLDEHYPPEAERALLKRLLAKEDKPRPTNQEQARRLWLKMARRLAAKGFDNALLTEELSAWLPEPLEMEY